MVLDYRERKPVNKNRPKSKPVGLFVVAFGAVACSSFVLGILADRYLLPPRSMKTDAVAVSQSPAPAPSNPVPQKVEGEPGQQNTPPPEPSLTFYETLPKGGRAILGSGINPKRPEAHGVSTTKTVVEMSPHKEQTPPRQAEPTPIQKTESPAPLPAATQSKGAAAGNTERQKVLGDGAKEASGKKTPATKGKFTVQVASAKERREAEAIKAALQDKGFAAYIVESPVSGKGTWYRIRVGKQMNQTAADSLATQLGKGAIIIPE